MNSLFEMWQLNTTLVFILSSSLGEKEEGFGVSESSVLLPSE